MFKQNRKYFLFFIAVFAGIVYMQVTAPKPRDWHKTYKSKDKIPFGCSAFFDVLDQSVFKGQLIKKKENIYKTFDGKEVVESSSSTLFINDNLKFVDVETEMLLAYVEKGNKILLAANTFDGMLADTLNLKTNIEFSYFDPLQRDSANTFIFHPKSSKPKFYSFKEGVPPVHLTSLDTTKAIIIATDLKKNPVFISMKFGKGEIYVLTTPEVFTNFAFVKKPAREFAYTAVSYLNMPEVRFDEYYKSFNEHIESDLQFIFNNDSLYAAYSIAILSILIFMIFNLKRRQRAVPVITPPTNSTMDFVEVIGNVYFNANNHKIIADEKINAFLESIRAKFQVNTQLITDVVLRRINVLSGIERKEIDKLFNVVETIQYARNISEQQLIELNTLIEQFHKKNKR